MDENKIRFSRLRRYVFMFPLLTGLFLLLVLAGIFCKQSDKNASMETELREDLTKYTAFAVNSIHLHLQSVRRMTELIAREPAFLSRDKQSIVQELRLVSETNGFFENIALIDSMDENAIDDTGVEKRISEDETAIFKQALEQKKSVFSEVFRSDHDTLHYILAVPVLSGDSDQVLKVLLAGVIAGKEELFREALAAFPAGGPFHLAVTDVKQTAWFPFSGSDEKALRTLLPLFDQQFGRQSEPRGELYLNHGDILAKQGVIAESNWRVTAYIPLTAGKQHNGKMSGLLPYVLLAGALVMGLMLMICKRFSRTVDLLEKETFTDDKTGLYNFRMFQEFLQHEFAGAQKRGHELTLLFLDIDHFKKINDRYGHQTGDKILKMIADQVKRHVRPTDFVARYGGEEIAVVCPNTSLEAGREVALRLRQMVKNCTLAEGGELGQEKISVSIGISSSFSAQSKEELIDQADKCMYLAKKKGRDRVVSIDETI